MINEVMPTERVEIGRIDILDNFSYVEVGSSWVDELIFAMSDKFVKGRQIVFEPAEAKAKKSSDRERRGRKSLRDNSFEKKKETNKSKKRRK